MAISVADISKSAFDGVAKGLSGVVKTATLTVSVKGAFTPATGAVATTESTTAGRAVFGTASSIPSRFPAYDIGPDDYLVSLEGFTVVPSIGDVVTIDSVARSVKAVGDIAGAGEFFEVIIS